MTNNGGKSIRRVHQTQRFYLLETWAAKRASTQTVTKNVYVDFFLKSPTTHCKLIALPEAKIASDKLAHDREIKDVKEALKSIVSTLDSIELALGRGD